MPTETISLARQFDNAISDEQPDTLKPQENCLTPSSQKKKKAGVFEKQLLAIATVQNRQNACEFDQQFSENRKLFQGRRVERVLHKEIFQTIHLHVFKGT